MADEPESDDAAAPRRRLSDRTARRLSVVVGLATLALGTWLCARPAPVVLTLGPPTLTVADLPAQPPEDEGPAPITPVDSCEALAASEDPRDAALLPALCPTHALTLRQAKAALLAAPDLAAVARLRPALTAHGELVAIADLALATRGPIAEGDFDPDTPVVPVTDDVVAWARRAEHAIVDKDVDHDTRTKAQALLARIYRDALARLGSAPGESLPPFARRIAALALYHGRRFCDAYWRRRVSGLHDAFAQTEQGLFDIVASLQVTPFFTADAMTIHEHERGLDYVMRSIVTKRLADGAADQIAGWPATARIERLVGQGLFDLAVEHAADIAGTGDPVIGLQTAEQWLHDAARRTDRPEATARCDARLAGVRARKSPPSETGEGELPPPTWPWPGTEETASRADAWWHVAATTEGFARRHAIARALATTSTRPDAARVLLRRALAADAPEALAVARVELARQLRALEPDRPADLPLVAAVDGGDTAQRAAFVDDLGP